MDEYYAQAATFHCPHCHATDFDVIKNHRRCLNCGYLLRNNYEKTPSEDDLVHKMLLEYGHRLKIIEDLFIPSSNFTSIHNAIDLHNKINQRIEAIEISLESFFQHMIGREIDVKKMADSLHERLEKLEKLEKETNSLSN